MDNERLNTDYQARVLATVFTEEYPRKKPMIRYSKIGPHSIWTRFLMNLKFSFSALILDFCL
ncbi:MAG: hypothetical protein AAF483_28405 [Planctomycetota bacterium]